MSGAYGQHPRRCEIIAEAGVNHNGELEIAKKLVDEAAEAGVDVVKFQTFDPDEVVTAKTEKAEYQQRSSSESQYEMLSRVVLEKREHEALFSHCSDRGVEFLSTPYDPDSVALLESIGVSRYKIASADIINKPLLEAVVETGKPIILSTGMANLGEIERAVSFLDDNGCEDFTLLHCISEYPTAPEDVNLRFMETLATVFDTSVGFSDHTLGTHVPVMAATLGATVVEKHFTLDRSMAGPDHAASLEPNELATMVETIRDVSVGLGDGTCTRPSEERENAYAMRRSLHARRDLQSGATIERSDISVVRPFEGIDPWKIDDVVGRTLRIDLEVEDPINWSHLE